MLIHVAIFNENYQKQFGPSTFQSGWCVNVNDTTKAPLFPTVAAHSRRGVTTRAVSMVTTCVSRRACQVAIVPVSCATHWGVTTYSLPGWSTERQNMEPSGSGRRTGDGGARYHTLKTPHVGWIEVPMQFHGGFLCLEPTAVSAPNTKCIRQPQH